ncbi:MAG: mandelate racemase/muconate lactonizing enzyme family protein [Chloroflexi bacterium]|nr:mandelate racemase/muconate lactonizing enzyme family protein [Chloroflexota bacterium]
MIVNEIRWVGIKVPFRKPLETSAGALALRYSLLIWVDTDEGVTGVGEAPAPLVGGESGLRRLDSLLQAIAPSVLGRSLEQVSRSLPTAGADGPSAQALSFALETAAYDALGRAQGQPVAALLGGRPEAIAVNALIGASSPEETSALAAEAVARGFGTIKLKVGGRPIGEDVAVLEVVRAAVGGDVKIRLDANRAWPLGEAIDAVRRLAGFGPEYIEEPVVPADPASLAEVRRSSTTAIAADESVESLEAARRLVAAGAADVLVIKAARVGGLREATAIAGLARSNGLRVVVTSSLETGIGLASSLHLAAALIPDEVSGLATGHLLEHDLLTEPLLQENGFLHTPQLPGLGISVDRDALKRYATGLHGRANL